MLNRFDIIIIPPNWKLLFIGFFLSAVGRMLPAGGRLNIGTVLRQSRNCEICSHA